jgi:hypothetical protein
MIKRTMITIAATAVLWAVLLVKWLWCRLRGHHRYRVSVAGQTKYIACECDPRFDDVRHLLEEWRCFGSGRIGKRVENRVNLF